MKWTEEEIKLLRINYSNLAWDKLLKLFPGRSRTSITEKSQMFGLKRSRFSTKGGFYQVYGLCPRHGRVLITEIRWNSNAPKCPRPYCNRILRLTPRHKSRGRLNV